MAQECRNVVNNGVHVATVCMPVGKTEAEWAEKLAPYYTMTGLPVVPRTVTPYGFRRALRDLNISTQFAAHIETLSPDDQDKWEYAIEFDRNDSLIKTVTDALGYTTAYVDSIFVKAGKYSG